MQIVVRNNHTRESEICETGSLLINPGNGVVFESRYGIDLGTALGNVPEGVRNRSRETRNVIRLASGEDGKTYNRFDADAHKAEGICRKKIESHGLKMQLVGAHYLLDRSKLLFFFTADQRVDFRNLVRDLVANFHLRVELRQIGVRDETRMLGGIGVCGRTLCCASVSDHLAPVSIRMAKNQNYSLNSMKVSGPCGRLLCCLAYENEIYEIERKRYPREGSSIRYDDTRFRVQEINVLSQRVKMGSEDGRIVTMPVCAFYQDPKGWTVELKNCPQIEGDRALHTDHLG